MKEIDEKIAQLKELRKSQEVKVTKALREAIPALKEDIIKLVKEL